jgi:predicted ATPase
VNPKDNPFAPGAGTSPPELAGRSGLLRDGEVAIARAKQGRGKGLMLLGLRGVGKTVLLRKLLEVAEQEHAISLFIEAAEDQSLASMLVPLLRTALLQLSGTERTKNLAATALGALRVFASTFKVKLGEFEIGVKAPAGIADSGQLERDLQDLLETVALVARADQRALVILVDEVQFLQQADLAALIVATHALGQKSLPFLVLGAGLPQLAGLAGDAKSYAERLFDYPDVGPLPPEAARSAIVEPLKREGIAIEPAALEQIVSKTQGFPFFLQEWGSQVWNAAAASPIDVSDVALATKSAVERLDQSFFKVRLNRLTPREKEYLQAMALLGPGPHNSGDIAAKLDKQSSAVAPFRDGLIKKGMIFSRQHGKTEFTVPLFDEFLRRTPL